MFLNFARLRAPSEKVAQPRSRLRDTSFPVWTVLFPLLVAYASQGTDICNIFLLLWLVYVLLTGRSLAVVRHHRMKVENVNLLMLLIFA